MIPLWWHPLGVWTSRVSQTAIYRFAVDWNNDGDFADPDDDVTNYVVEASWAYGRDYASQLTGRSIAGSCRLLLRNDDGRFSPFNTASPLAGNLLPGRPIRILMDDDVGNSVVWRGFIDTIAPNPELGGGHTAELIGLGPLGRLSQREVNIAMQTNIKTGAAINEILDKAGWPAADRDIDAGQVTMTRFWTGFRVSALFALQLVETTEGLAFFRETREGKLAFEDRRHRLSAASQISDVTFSDLAGDYRFQEIRQEDPLKEVFNVVRGEVRSFAVGALQVLWTLGETPQLGAGQSVSYFASYPNPGSPVGAVAVNAWTTPTSGTDYTANSQADGLGTNLTANIGVSVSKFDTSMKITLTNNGGVSAYITLLQARGTPLDEGAPVTVEAVDAASQAKYGERSYPLDARFLPSTAAADDYVNGVLSVYKDPIPVVTIRYSATRNHNLLQESRLRDVSDRITLTANNTTGLGLDRDFFVEAIRHTVTDNGQRHQVEYDLSDAAQFGGFWVLGFSALGSDTRLSW